MRGLGPTQAQHWSSCEMVWRNGAGYDNYWELGLASQGLTTKDIDQLIKDLMPVVQPLIQNTSAQVQAEAENLGVQNNFANRMMIRRKLGLETVWMRPTTTSMQTWPRNAFARPFRTWALPPMVGRSILAHPGTHGPESTVSIRPPTQWRL